MHHAGHCVTAHVLGLRVSRVKAAADGVCDVSWQRGEQTDGRKREVVEADALVALAGVATQWLYRDGSVRAAHVRRDDAMASVVLRQIEKDEVIEKRWREYLRQRALRMVSEPLNQLLIARLAGFLVSREQTAGREIHAFLDHERSSVDALLADPATTLEERIGLAAHRTFANPIERLGFDSSLERTLRNARTPTLGSLLQYSAYDLRALVSSETVDRIMKAVAARGYDLAKYPRSNVRETVLSV